MLRAERPGNAQSGTLGDVQSRATRIGSRTLLAENRVFPGGPLGRGSGDARHDSLGERVALRGVFRRAVVPLRAAENDRLIQ